jgi:thioredoxin-like negative regulator of GroEL
MPHSIDSINETIKTQNCVIKFTAPWCGPCQAIEKELIEQTRKRGVTCIKVDIDVHQEIAEAFQVTSIPMMIIASNGKSIKVTGANMEKIIEAFDTLHLHLLIKNETSIEALVVPSATVRIQK